MMESLHPIELIREGMLVWARDESTGKMVWKPVLQTFVTHPTEFVTIELDTNGDGLADESHVGTHEHPFWAAEQKAWVEMGNLMSGSRLLDKQGATSITVLSSQRQNAPPGETFTTYNFEVADFHTYFIGEQGVWVHNVGREPCERVFEIYHRFRARGDDPWEAFEKVVNKTSGVPSQTYGLAAGEAMDEIYRLAAVGESVTVPSHTMVRALMKGRNIKFSDVEIPEGSFLGTINAKTAEGIFKKLRLESHHGAPKQFQKWLGITDKATQDSSPAYLTSFLEHRGKQVGIHQALENVLGFPIKGDRPAGFTDAQLIQKLRDAYAEIGLEDFGDVSINWLNQQL